MKRVAIAWNPARVGFRAVGASGVSITVAAPSPAPDEPGGATSRATTQAGPTPSELLLIAAGTCTAWDAIEILRKQRQDVTGIEIEVVGEQQDGPPWTYRSMTMTFRVEGRGLDPERVERVVRLSEEKYCSVSATLRETAPVTIVVSVVEPSESPAPA